MPPPRENPSSIWHTAKSFAWALNAENSTKTATGTRINELIVLQEEEDVGQRASTAVVTLGRGRRHIDHVPATGVPASQPASLTPCQDPVKLIRTVVLPYLVRTERRRVWLCSCGETRIVHLGPIARHVALLHPGAQQAQARYAKEASLFDDIALVGPRTLSAADKNGPRSQK